jgi:hypothetical protein
MVLSHCSFNDLGKFLHIDKKGTCGFNSLAIGLSSYFSHYYNSFYFWLAKAKTIEKFLGKDFKVASSFGHIARWNYR